MTNILPVTKTRAMMLGKLAGLSAALAMVIVTPLISLASPAMCGRNPLAGNWKKDHIIQGFTVSSDNTKFASFNAVSDNTPLQLGSWVEVSGPDPKTNAIVKVPVVVVKATYNKKNNNYDLISFNYGLQNTDAWQVNFTVDKVQGCSPTTSPCTIPRLANTDPSVALVKPIVDMKFDPAPAKTPIMLGSWVEVSVTDPQSKKVTEEPAAIIGAVKQHVDPTKGFFARGYLPPSDSLPNGKLVQITITQDVMKQITSNIVKAGGTPGTW